MSVTTEPEVQSVRLSFTTNAAANTVQNDAVLAAPGGGLRYRIYGCSIHYSLSNAAANNFIGRLASGAVELFACGLVQGSKTSDNQTWPMGIPTPTNTAVNMAELCSAVTVGYRLTVQYVIETG